MISKTRLDKLLLMAALVFGGWAIKVAFNASAHDGKMHAPPAAKKLRNPIAQPTATDIANGKALYDQHCAKCHGKNGRVETQGAQRLKPKPADLTGHNAHMLTDGELFWITTNGILPSGMPAMKSKMSDQERWQTIVYLRQLNSPPAAALGIERHKLRGKIIRIDADIQRITVDHEAVDGVMGAMKMGFMVKDVTVLTPFKVGDLIEAELVSSAVTGEAWLENFKRQRVKKR